jgi:hypothetical protein
MRMVRVTITYDMDDANKPLNDELQDWLEGRVNVQDIVDCYERDAEPFPVTIEEVRK